MFDFLLKLCGKCFSRQNHLKRHDKAVHGGLLERQKLKKQFLADREQKELKPGAIETEDAE